MSSIALKKANTREAMQYRKKVKERWFRKRKIIIKKLEEKEGAALIKCPV